MISEVVSYILFGYISNAYIFNVLELYFCIINKVSVSELRNHFPERTINIPLILSLSVLQFIFCNIEVIFNNNTDICMPFSQWVTTITGIQNCNKLVMSCIVIICPLPICCMGLCYTMCDYLTGYNYHHIYDDNSRNMYGLVGPSFMNPKEPTPTQW